MSGDPHQELEALRAAAAGELAEVLPGLDWSASVVLPDDPELADAPRKIFLFDGEGRPVGVALWSNDVAPGLIARGQDVAAAARQRLGRELGSVILQALAEGEALGRSFAVLPWCGSWSSVRWRWWMERRRLRRPVLRWLRGAAAATRAPAPAAEVLRNLHQLRGSAERLPELAEALARAQERLETGDWRPSHALDHNDLWAGNLMRPPAGARDATGSFPFVIIDWVGATLEGTGLVDLLRMGSALKLSTRALRREVLSHAAALGCEPADCAGQLLAGLGRLGRHREHLSEARYHALVESHWQRFAALGC